MGTAASAVLARAGLQVQLGCRSAAQAERVAAERENAAYLPGVELDSSIEVKTVPELDSRAWTSSCWPCPARASRP